MTLVDIAGASKLFDGLIKHDAALKVVPALAAEMPTGAGRVAGYPEPLASSAFNSAPIGTGPCKLVE